MKKRILISILVISLAGLAIIGGLFAYTKFFENKEEATEVTNDNKSEVEQDKKEEVKQPINTSIVFTGDVLLSDYVLSNYNSKGIEGVVSQSLRDKMTSADFTMVNMEFPFSTRGTKAPDKQYTFRVDPKYVKIIQELGIDAVGIANNHVLDFGKEALEDTFTTLTGANIQYTGAGHNLEEASKLVTFEKDGVKVGVLAASRVIPVVEWNVQNSQPGVFTCYDPAILISDIQKAKNESKCDLVFVMVHWGTEHTDVLTDYQKSMAHQLVDAGADCVIGAHPHVVQGIEKYNDKMIFYSLGNYIFNQNIERTFALNINYDNVNVKPSYKLYPAKATGATTSDMSADAAASLYSYLNSISTGVTINAQGDLQ